MKLSYFLVPAALASSCQIGDRLGGPATAARAEGSGEPGRYPSANSALGEKLYPHEEELARQIADVIAASIRRQSAVTGKAVRDAHPKADGCVTATFRIEDNLRFDSNGKTVDLAHGAFNPAPRTRPGFVFPTPMPTRHEPTSSLTAAEWR